MVNPFTAPALGGALLAAVVLGVHLGESAVGLIDPIYFQGPAVHPRDRGAAIDPDAIRPRPAAYGDLYGWDEGHAARLADCGDCAALAARDAHAYSAVVPYFGGPAEPRRAEPAAAAPAPPKPAGDWQEREVPIARYAHYPVTSDERRIVPAYAADDVYLDAPEGEDKPLD